jgi:putative glycosyltransferase (TIGR04372 family)
MLIADRLSSKFWADMYWLRGDWEVKRDDLARPMLFVPPSLMYLGREMFALDHPDPWKVNYLIFGDMVDATLFAIPPQIAAESERQLLALGLDRDKWFITLHIREDGYRVPGYQAARLEVPLHPRSVAQVERYVAAIDLIIAKGGQVVRLGDSTMTELPPRKGFVDLSRIKNSFLLQAYACSRSRFLLGGDSGPTVIATGFNTPAAAVNLVNGPVAMTVPKNHVLATKGFRLDDRRVVWDRDAESLDLMSETAWYGRVNCLEELSENELCRVCEVMLARTEGISGWVEREPSPANFWAGERRISAADIDRRMSWQRIYLSDILPRQL